MSPTGSTGSTGARAIATAALQQFLSDPQLRERPLYASAAHDNLGSIRVLEKCGFTVIGSAKAFANGRGVEIEETCLVLTKYADQP